jgi:hypothetical protein
MELARSKTLLWTAHSRAKMIFYRLSEGRVRRVLNTPKRIEEGVAPKTIAMMQPSSMKTATTWSQEIWVMVQDAGSKRKVISAWRYPGVTKPRAVLQMMQKEYREYAKDKVQARVRDEQEAAPPAKPKSEFFSRPVTKNKKRRLYKHAFNKFGV